MSVDRQNEAERTYEELFIQFSSRIEKLLLLGVKIVLLALVASQLLLQVPQLRHGLVKVERLEGKPYLHESVSVHSRAAQ
ncbi:hypothetical protein [Paenibacillus sp. YYML68]|uniref:hypothetical protein n=1 Tax=Paenibacillus sp. YYML68 TaxID=2909250 RepID=UPI0024920DF5|nr:hypothetical protein [Paenibacillus sp. YYML68]